MDQPQELRVRRASTSDLDEVAGVWHASALEMDGSPQAPTLEALRSRIDAELRSGWDLHVALAGERVVGLLALRHADAWLDQLFVSPTERGKGVGRCLLKTAKREMSAGFTLRTAASNRKAACFYEKEGLTLVGTGVHPWTGVPVKFYGWNVR